MSHLIFKAAAVRRVVEHSLKHKSANVLLVHDDGVYLMSDAQPRDIVEGTRSFVAHAMGTDPKVDTEDWYDNARDLVGGDDFGEELPWAADIKQELDTSGSDTITLKFTANTIELVRAKRKRVQ